MLFAKFFKKILSVVRSPFRKGENENTQEKATTEIVSGEDKDTNSDLFDPVSDEDEKTDWIPLIDDWE